MVERRRPFSEGILLSIMAVLLSRCDGREFSVGDKDGWVPQPSESYNNWAERNRFQVNDTLYFKYSKGDDSVLIVSKNDYYTCNISNPIKSLTDGNSVFKFDRSGPFYFISGIPGHCNSGQRLPIIVLAIRPSTQPPTASLPQKPSPGPFIPGNIVPPGSARSSSPSSSPGTVLAAIMATTFVVYVTRTVVLI